MRRSALLRPLTHASPPTQSRWLPRPLHGLHWLVGSGMKVGVVHSQSGVGGTMAAKVQQVALQRQRSCGLPRGGGSVNEAKAHSTDPTAEGRRRPMHEFSLVAPPKKEGSRRSTKGGEGRQRRSSPTTDCTAMGRGAAIDWAQRHGSTLRESPPVPGRRREARTGGGDERVHCGGRDTKRTAMPHRTTLQAKRPPSDGREGRRGASRPLANLSNALNGLAIGRVPRHRHRDLVHR